MSLKRKILAIVLSLLLVAGGSSAVYAYGIISTVSGDTLDESTLSINDLLSEDTVNIALFGIDGRDDVEGDRSDTIMIASINFKTGEIKITSIMRDLMVQIPAGTNNDVTYEKINAAYQYGGAQQAVQTLNENFDLNITDYIVVNFDCLVDTVDALGGVDINVQNDDVLYWTNQYIMDVNDKTHHADPFLETTGANHMTGVQALAYCRNRYSDDDYGRTERQREVVQQIFNKATSADLLTTVNVIGRIYPYISTSLSLQEMSTYAKGYMALENKSFVSKRVPFDEYNTTGDINGVSYVIPVTLRDNTIALHKLIYGDDVSYTPSDKVNQISNRITQLSGYGSGSSSGESTSSGTFSSPANSGSSSGTSSGSGTSTTTPETNDNSSSYTNNSNTGSGSSNGTSTETQQNY